MKKFLIESIYGISTLLTLWNVLSWVEVIFKNLNPNAQYSAWNIFAMLFLK